MSETSENQSSGNTYKIASIILGILLLVGIGVGVYYYNQTQQELDTQNQKIDDLNKQVTEAKSTATTEIEATKNQVIDSLNQKNQELQEQLEAAQAKIPSTDTDSETSQ